MAFSMQCNNLKCGKLQEPYYDPETDKVFCSICEKEIVNITHFIKLQLKNNKQYKPKKQVAFGIKCNKCKSTDQPILNKDEVVCKSCNSPLNVSLVFKRMLKEQLKNIGKSIDEDVK